MPKTSGLVAALSLNIVVSAAVAAPLTFNGVSGRSTFADVKASFPSAQIDRLCAGETARYADGVSLCEFLKVPSYKLAGYDFSVTFWFNENRTLKNVTLTWPGAPSDDGAAIRDAEIDNAYWAMIDLLVSKYGRQVGKPPCSYIGANCQEWQMDGTTEWHAGGERIEIRYELRGALRGLKLKYTFADLKSFNRF